MTHTTPAGPGVRRSRRHEGNLVWVHGPGQEPWEVYVVKADADSLTRQQGSTCCTGPAATDTGTGTGTGTGTEKPVTASGCC